MSEYYRYVFEFNNFNIYFPCFHVLFQNDSTLFFHEETPSDTTSYVWLKLVRVRYSHHSVESKGIFAQKKCGTVVAFETAVLDALGHFRVRMIWEDLLQSLSIFYD